MRRVAYCGVETCNRTGNPTGRTDHGLVRHLRSKLVRPVARRYLTLSSALISVLIGQSVHAALIADIDHDCLYLEKNSELAFVDMPMGNELNRTAWAYTRDYAERFLMPEENIETLVGAIHSRYVVRQDVSLICETGSECWPMNHCQLELYVPSAANILAGRDQDSYQDPMWGDTMARFLSPIDPEDVRHMNERRSAMRYDRMVYQTRQLKQDGDWVEQGPMQLIGYRKSISDELDALVVEGDCNWYRDPSILSGRIVLEEQRDGELWRHEIELPGSYLKRMVEESNLRLWPSVDAYNWWWADTWWPEEGYTVDYDDRFSDTGAQQHDAAYWIWDTHVWDYMEEFADRFGMPRSADKLTAKEGGLKGAYAMTSIISCKGLQDGLYSPYTTRHGYHTENLHAKLDYVYYCEGSENPVYEFYLPYSELKAMGLEEMNLAVQKTWMPVDVLRGWRQGEKPIELCRHPDFDEWFWGYRYFRGDWLSQLNDRINKVTPGGTGGTLSQLALDVNLLPGVYMYIGSKWMFNLNEGIRKYYFFSLRPLPKPGRTEQKVNERLRTWGNIADEIDKVFKSLETPDDVEKLNSLAKFQIFRASDYFGDKYLANKPQWQRVLDRVDSIAESVRKGARDQ